VAVAAEGVVAVVVAARPLLVQAPVPETVPEVAPPQGGCLPLLAPDPSRPG
jgi:hypothetical protein